MLPLVLASSSPYRAQLLSKLGLAFTQDSPNIDESTLTKEEPHALVERLAIEKAQALSNSHPASLIIGSDQVAHFQGEIIGKPGNHPQAAEQLRQFSGHTVEFCTGICLLNSQTQQWQSEVSRFKVHFHKLSAAQIDGYLKQEQPYDCAGSFKSEGLGIALFSRLEGDDPNSLVGLPLIKLVEMLNNEGIDPLLANGSPQTHSKA